MSKSPEKLSTAKKRLLEGIGIPEPGEFVIDDFQREAIEGTRDSSDVLVVAPTGAGKTFIALKSIEDQLHRGGSSVYTTPLKALSNTKYNELRTKFSPTYDVGLLTGDRKIEGDAKVVVATTEIYRNELYRSSQRFSLVVLDEVHYLADPQRGPVWEESIILTPRSSTLLMLSASISNSSEIAAWISEVRGKECRVVRKEERPVELRYGFLHPSLGVLPLRSEDGDLFPEVKRFYQGTSLDPTGMRLRGGGRRKGSKGRGGGGRSRRQRGSSRGGRS